MSTIKPGTLCLLTQCSALPHLAGSAVTFVCWGSDEWRPLPHGHDCCVEVQNLPAPSGTGTWGCDSRFLVPLDNDDIRLSFEIERECEREHETC